MGFSPGIVSWALFGISGLNLGIAAVAVRRREVRGAVAFSLVMICVSLYSVGTGIRAGSTTLSLYQVGTVVKFAGILGLGPTQLRFGLIYTGRESLLTRRRWALLLAWPAAVFALVATAPAHDLLWTVRGFSSAAPLAAVDRANGPLFWLTLAYTYTLILTTYSLLLVFGIRRGGQYRTQVLLMLSGGIIPVIGSFLLLYSGNLSSAFDPTAFANTVTGVVFAVALFGFGFLDLAPVARHTLVDEMVDPVYVVDVDDRVVDVNVAGMELLGEGVGEPVGRPAAEVVPLYDSFHESTDDADSDVTVERDGSLRFFDINRTTLTDRSGATIGSLLIYRDVTERHITEKRFERLIQQSSDIIAVIDKSGDITHVSQSVEEILGYGPTALIGANVIENVHPNDQDELRAELSAHATEYGYTSSYRVRFRHADGEWRVLEVRARNLLKDQFVEGIVLNSRDVTEKERQRRKLERQNERLDQFASIVSHDLRNPLNVATGHVDMLASDAGSEQEDSIETVQRQLERMEAIISDALTLARSGEVITETTEVRLEDISRTAWQNVDTAEADLVGDTSLTLDADKDRLLNVFENLYRNSVEHNETTGLTVRVGPLSETFGFYVEDTGTGIPEDKRGQVLEQGYTTNREGTGFGLAIVRDIVRAHGWQITVSESDEGGARFEIECAEVPLEEQPATA
ncbi:histidine kinase N-terminal 7TM domain-containing protein [Halorubrum ezzemoulense]|uniref:histidine kinase n=1 Tax=Halorubrum ezzemoulense TaxID=337243 RepID=A0ABT4Z2G5_HALEZ|nr:histidine kinase N-terminal 7TM domain-containing protein [Halorubrum ezzemoulense]MDB2244842.1 histidine kinase N-terminal 7TM domain-containing protein [Halorubrum ezzemoulense]MDB2251049.1 histidine kinase N-terminal 7TM domain-containing protein [Halorubrum ezzemoulense]MDB2278401.1 histidine kinase N-terminal 7TM domain-containing protein [Halorubrum ezzemoulense]MDB2285075.1 histidine kinase N-terminal 7TM domain-containing protein [Halorubrum ezzemoulense]MDB2288176.1 histidine kinas